MRYCTDQTTILPREAPRAVPAEELEVIPGVGEAARLAEARASVAWEVPYSLRAVWRVLDEGMMHYS